MNGNKIGLVLGSFLGLMHLGWSVLVALDWGQGLLDFIYKMHSLNNPFTVLPFDLGRSLGLVVITSAIGYVVGNIFATLWNKFHKEN